MAITLNIVSKFDNYGITSANSALNGLGKGFGKIAAVGAAAFAAAGVAAGYFAVDAMKAADESAKVGRVLENALKNAGGFGETAEDIKNATKEIQDFTQALALTTGISDETYNALATAFLAAPQIAAMGTDAVNRLVATASDIAATTGKDLESVGTALTKALESPETAISKLARAGVFLTNEQEKVYKSILDTNDVVGAQRYLIDELAGAYAGAAEAAASPWEKLNETFEWAKELIGTELLEAITPLIPSIQEMVKSLVEDPRFTETIQELADAFIELTPQVLDLVPQLLDLGLKILPLILDILPFIIPLVQGLADAISAMGDGLGKMEDEGQTFLGWLFVVVPPLAMLGIMIDNTNKMFGAFGDVVAVIVAGPLGMLMDWVFNFNTKMAEFIDQFDEFMRRVNQPIYTPTGQFDVGAAFMRTLGIPQFAEGGIVMGPTLGVVGEAGPEAIIPLDRMGSIGGNVTYQINVTAGVGDPVSIGQQVVSYIKRYERASGPVFAGA